ncbi:MAG: hypothetical protein QOG53_1883 [Frankiales bacterium]|nr:hypothetical protein [Frankiales bacterium]
MLPIAARAPERIRHRLLARHHEAVSSRRVTGLVTWLRLMRYRDWVDRDRALGTYAAARRGVSGAVVYSYYWSGFAAASSNSRAQGPSLLFQVHPPAREVQRALSADRERTGCTFDVEPEEKASAEELDVFQRSLQIADGAITASTYVAEALANDGLPRHQIAVVPYGAEAIQGDFFRERGHPGPLRALWVGQVVYRKGIHDVLEAVDALGGDVRLTLVTRAISPHWAERLGSNVEVVVNPTRQELQRLYAQHDVFVLPSLIEGFGLVYLEAMAAGLAVIGTTNTGLPDVITDGVEGRVLPVGRPDELANTLAELARSRELSEEMGRAARVTAKTFTWARFRQGVLSAASAAETRRRQS